MAVKFADRFQSYLISSYKQIRDIQKQRSPTAWLALVSLAPFRRWVPYSDPFLKDYVVSLQKAQIHLQRFHEAQTS